MKRVQKTENTEYKQNKMDQENSRREKVNENG